MMRVISLGAGVQSTTMALMATCGELEPMPDCAIFADVGDEPPAVYRHLEWLMSPGQLAFPVHIVRASDYRAAITRGIGDEIMAKSRGESAHAGVRPPLFTLAADGSRGMLRRQCTQDYKIVPIQQKIRELLGLRKRQWWPKEVVVEQWMGISRDEATRMKPSRIPAISVRWPLIESGMSRADCLEWMRNRNYQMPPRSSCVFCPFHSNAEWRNVRADPIAWARALEIDAAVRRGLTRSGELFLHSSRVPLADANIDDEQPQFLWDNECEGMCGV